VKTDPNFYKDLLDHISDGVYFVDCDRRILYWNQGACRLTGYTAGELLGRRCPENTLCHVDAAGNALCEDGCPLTASFSDGASKEAQVFLRHKQGRRVPVSVRVQPIRAADGSVMGAVEIFSDDSANHAVRRKTDELERLAFVDQVTRLPNRRYVEMSIATELNEYFVHYDPFGVLMIDFDHFKEINDRFGHANGDRALREAGKTLSAALRGTDIVGRWGGDEFIAVVRHVDTNTLRDLADRCCALISQTAIPRPDGDRIPMSVSIGGTVVIPDDTPEQLIHRADERMYRSKTSGRNRAAVE
jgi:diguanylate cyclase (GGDEF)-like protein/PAS domain S-box-containing protein